MIEETFNQAIEVLNKVFVPTFWDCSAPITVSQAKTPEGIVKDVKAASKGKFDYSKLKEFNVKEFKFTDETIPYCILVVTAVGIIAQVVAYFAAVSWYLMPVVFICLIMFCVMRQQEMKKVSEESYY